MRFIKYFFCTLLIALSGITAPAEETPPATGTELITHCRVYTQLAPMPWGFKMLETNPSIGICLAHMTRILELRDTEPEQLGKTLCLPKDITPGQLISVFVTYGDQYPQSLRQESLSAEKDVLSKAFPCKAKP